MSDELNKFMAEQGARLTPEQKEIFELLDTLGPRDYAHLLGFVCRLMLEPGMEFWSAMRQALYDPSLMEVMVLEEDEPPSDSIT
jgi:uncharacterized protein with von Willebrand factor type A (vWA) domain